MNDMLNRDYELDVDEDELDDEIYSLEKEIKYEKAQKKKEMNGPNAMTHWFHTFNTIITHMHCGISTYYVTISIKNLNIWTQRHNHSGTKPLRGSNISQSQKSNKLKRYSTCLTEITPAPSPSRYINIAHLGAGSDIEGLR